MTYIVTERLCLTEDGTLVPEGHPKGRWFYAAPGTEITDAEARKYGLLKDDLEPAAPAALGEPLLEAAPPEPEQADPKPKKRSTAKA